MSENYLVICSPVFLCLMVKMYYGVMWWYKQLAREYLMKYYNVSWTYYTAFFITQSLFLMTAWGNLTHNTKILLIILGIFCFPAWFLLYFYMDFRETQHFSIKAIL